MKGIFATAALAAMATGASAHNNHRRAHDLFKKSAESACTPGCTTIVHTIVGEPTFCPDAPPAKPTTTEAPPPPPVVTPPPPPPAPTPEVPATTEIPVVPVPGVSTCETPGTYTIPAETIVIDKTVTVCAAASTHLPPGTHTYGEITTVVEGHTTVTCPYADATNGAEAPVTTHVCPEAGVCTVVPGTTTVVESDCDVYYPIPTVYAPGTYTHSETVVTVTVDKYVAYCPFSTSEKPAPPAPTKPAPAPKPEAPPAPEYKPKVETPKVETPKVEKPKAEKPKTSKPKSGGNAYAGTLGSDTSDHYGVTYTPYEPTNGNCKDAASVEKDIVELKGAGFTTLRIYSTDCNTLDTVGPAVKKHGLKLIVGVFVKTGCSYNSPDIKEQVDAIAAWADWEHVELFVVGNESIMNGLCSAEELSSLISTVKSKCSGYTGPYTIAETLDIYERSEVAGAICDAIDVVGANIHAFFNPNVSADMAGDFVAGQLEILESICPGKEAINLECGWPNGGECNGKACPGLKEQATALTSIRKKVGQKSVFFSYKNDEWKEPGAFNCEQKWGTSSYFMDN